MIRLLLALPLPFTAILVLGANAAAAPEGPTVYKRCAACHLPSGAGVPGTYPPLGTDFRALSGTAQGRRYLILVVIKGVSGPITVEGKAYRSVMPAQSGVDDGAIASVLNHVAFRVAKAAKSTKLFTAAEVNTARSSAVGLNAAAVGKLRPSAGRK